jgi:hypothetical protein
MKPTFHQLNEGWNAEPYAPHPVIEVQGRDLVLKFFVNALQFTEFEEGETGILRFVRCARYRLGPTNDDGWYGGQCRFSKLAPEWGEFYVVQGDAALLEAPQDWQIIASSNGNGRHFLFYFRDNTFECIAEQCIIEPSANNSLHRTGKKLRIPSADELKPSAYLRRRLCRS